MKFVVSSQELLRNLLIAQKAIPTKTGEAILENYLLELSGDNLTITASDKELTLKAVVKVDSAEEEGRIAILARQITDLLKEIPEQPLTIETTGENTFRCAWAGGESSFPYFDPDDYPEIKSAGEDAVTINVDAETLDESISKTVYASSDDSNRPIMNSIFYDIGPESTTVVASDLQKLVCYTTPNIKAAEPASFILSKRHAAVIRSILPKEDNVSVTFDQSVAVFRFANVTAVSMLVVGKYPNYKSIIPTNNSNILTISREQLLYTVRRVAVCSPKASNHIKFDLTQGSLEISAQDLGYEIAAHEKISCQYEGDDLTIGFKSTHLIEILSNLDSSEVTVKFADKRRSVLILPVAEEGKEANVFGIVMPIMVR